MILTRKRLLVDIFFTHRLSKSLAFCEFTSVNFVPWKGPHDSYIKTEEILKLLFQVYSSSEHFNITRRGQLIGNSTENWCCVLKLHTIENHQTCLNWCSVRKFVETSTMKPPKILRFLGHFQEEAACESCSKHSAFTENFKLVITFERSLLNRDFFTLGFD